MTLTRSIRRTFAQAFTVALSTANLQAQAASGSARWADSAATLIDRATRANDLAGVEAAVAVLDRVLTIVPGDGVLLHYKGYALYRRATLGMSTLEKRDLDATLKGAEEALIASEKAIAWPESPALLSSVYGQMIALNGNPISAMRLGSKAGDAMERAMALGARNPRVLLLRGIGSIYRPRVFGGGLDKAERDIREALALFPADKPAPTAPAWGFAEAWAWLGQVLARADRRDEARAAYQKALEVDPEFGWVKYVLLPALQKGAR